ASLLSFQAHAMDPIDDGRPNEHICPITREVMRDPVVAADGHSYEKNAILQCFTAGHTKSPLSGLPLKNKDLFDNHALKTMISEWKPGKQSEPSVLEKRSAESIAQRIKAEFSKNAVLLNSAKGQHIVAFLGNTGAGKSTLVNLLAGKKLVVDPEGEDYILAQPDDSTAMVIGTGGNSETLYPKAIDVEGLRFFDLPGFNDTDGSERNLVNAAFTRKILLDAASVRLVFVVGQDQFTADRGDSAKKMFHAIKQLFVVDQGISLVDDGVFVATKVTCNTKTDLTDFLLKKTDSRNNAELNQQLKSWSQKNRSCRMFHSMQGEHNSRVREQILGLIKETKPTKVHGINVSVLYPPDTKAPLERMFSKVLEGALERKFNAPLTTLSEYDRAITSYTSDGFWQAFDAEVGEQEEAIGLLKEFCINPYNNALRALEKGNEGKRQAHIQGLKSKRQTRVKD
ncbi:MAG: GTPase, partial [Bacillota bacterium]|nr:GTPase [Bacillota bacterium]